MSRRSGSVLILVVWVVSLLSMLAAGLGSHGLSALGLVDRLDGRLQASYIATGAAQRAMQVLADDLTPKIDGFTDDWANCASCFQQQPLADGRFSLGYTIDGVPIAGLLDEDRKLSLNSMPAEVFSALLVRRGLLKPIQADEIAAAIVDWRDEDHEESDHGAEGFYYQGLSPSYRCKDAPFQHVEELLLIKGMTLEVFERIAPWVTPYGSGALNLNTAGAGTLEALGLSREAVSAILNYRDGEDARPGTGDERVFASSAAMLAEVSTLMPPEDHAGLSELANQDLFGVRSTAFSAQIQATTEDGIAVTATFVMDRHGSILAWEER